MLITHAFGNLYQAVRSNRGILGVAAHRHCVGNPIANFQLLDVRAHCHNFSRSFLSGDEWKHCFVTAFAVIDVDEVHSRRRDLDDGLFALRFGNRELP